MSSSEFCHVYLFNFLTGHYQKCINGKIAVDREDSKL